MTHKQRAQGDLTLSAAVEISIAVMGRIFHGRVRKHVMDGAQPLRSLSLKLNPPWPPTTQRECPRRPLCAGVTGRPSRRTGPRKIPVSTLGDRRRSGFTGPSLGAASTRPSVREQTDIVNLALDL